MAVTLDPLTSGDFVEIDDADATTGWTVAGSMSMIALDTTSPVEGTGALQARVNSGQGTILHNRASQDMTDLHLRMWLKLAQGLDTVANGGGRLRAGTTTNYGEWNVYGSERQVTVYNGWMSLGVDLLRPFDGALGTPPAINAITDSGISVNWLDGNGKDLLVSDRSWFGNVLFIEGGTTGARGTFDEAVADDESNGYGLIRPVGGTFFANCELAFGETGTADSYFEDFNQVLVFEDLPVSAALYKIRHAANSTGTNHVQFGSSSGSGVNKEGTGGIAIKAAGDVPFRIEAIDANIDVGAYFGCTMTGPVTLYDDAFRNIFVEDNGTGFTDITRDGNYPYSAGASITSSSVANPTNILCAAAHGFQSGATVVISSHTGSTPSINGTHFVTVVDSTNFTIPVNVTVGGTGGSVVSGQTSNAMPTTQAANDATYFGHDEPFYELNIHLTVAKGGTWTGTWEYYDGTGWSSLANLTDGTANYATTGAQVVTFSIPVDWSTVAVNSATRYWIRFRITSFTSSGTTPVLASASAAMAGDVRLEDTAVEAIGCTVTQMGAVKIRSNAKFKKNVITDSIVPAKHGALDLGAVSPGTDEVRDNTIQNCINGIVVAPPGTGAGIIYPIPNTQFANNTVDVLNTGVAVLTDVWDETNQDSLQRLDDTEIAIGQIFDGVTERISRAKFYMSRTGSPTGEVVAKVSLTTGFGSYEPSGLILAESEPVDVTTIGGSLTLVDFEFLDEFLMTAVRHAVWLEYRDGDATNYLSVGYDNTPGHTYNGFTTFLGQSSQDPIANWQIETWDTIFYLYTGAIAEMQVTEGGDIPSVSSPGNGAIIISAPVTISIQVNDVHGNGIEGATIRLDDDDIPWNPLAENLNLVDDGTTNSTGLYENAAFNYVEDLNVTLKVRLKGFKNFRTQGQLTNIGFQITVLMETDVVVDLP